MIVPCGVNTMSWKFGSIIILLSYWGSSIDAMYFEQRVAKHVLRKYHQLGRHGRPVKNVTDAVGVRYRLRLRQIVDLDEKDQVIITRVWHSYEWKDEIVRWNATEFGGVNAIRLPIENIWRPDLVILNSAGTKLDDQGQEPIIFSDGKVLWIHPAIIKTTCGIDITYFPFDEQRCHLEIMSWTFDGSKLNLTEASGSTAMVERSPYVPSNEWQLLNFTGERLVTVYTCCREEYQSVVYTLHIKRIPVYHCYVLLLPCGLLSVLTLVIFWLPPDSTEKLSLGMSNFVAFFLLLLLLADVTPLSHTSIPLIGVYFCINMILITLSAFLSVIVTNVSARGDHGLKVPTWLTKTLVNRLARILCIGNVEISQEASPPKKEAPQHGRSRDMEVDCLSQEDTCMDDYNGPLELVSPRLGSWQDDIKAIREAYTQRLQQKVAQSVIMQKWKVVAQVLDRVFFLVYLLIIIISVLTVLVFA